MSSDLALALQLADLADALSLEPFHRRLPFEAKPDSTPVTEADLAVERELRDRLARERPDDAILGEEHGVSGGGSRRWILDPIDGTRNFARGVPVWATLIALEEDGVVLVGVVSAPALGRRWWAERGGGSFVDGAPVRVSSVARVEDAVLSCAYENTAPELARRAWQLRGFGDFWAHMLVAEGAVDVAVDATGIAIWDVAAVQVVVEEAGGRFSDFSGEARIDGVGAISSNDLLHDEVVEALAERASHESNPRSEVAKRHSP